MEPTQKDIPPCGDNEYREVAWGIKTFKGPIEPFYINRPKVGDFDVKMDMKFCGICHTDCHMGLGQMPGAIFPMVPGHELVGIVTEVGSKVTKVKVGDKAGVGCVIDSCLECPTCKEGDENYCEGGGSTHTYNSLKKYGHIGGNPDTQNFGGYAGSEVVHEHFILKVPDAIPLDKAGPIMCAGITLYAPMRYWGAIHTDKKLTIGIVGIGGLGTMGIKIAKAAGHRVVAFSTSAHKEASAKEKGADDFVISSDPASVATQHGKCDMILNTVSAEHDLNVYLACVKASGRLVQLGAVAAPHSVSQLSLIFQRKSISGSLVGGIEATQELLDFCAKHNIAPDVQHIEAKEIQWAWDQLCTINKDGIRYVIDIEKSLQNKDFLPADA